MLKQILLSMEGWVSRKTTKVCPSCKEVTDLKDFPLPDFCKYCVQASHW